MLNYKRKAFLIIYFLVLLLLSFPDFCYSQKKESDLLFQGKIEKIIVDYFTINADQSLNLLRKQLLVFNEAMSLNEKSEIDANGVITKATYFKKGKTDLERVAEIKDSSGQIVYTTVTSYDSSMDEIMVKQFKKNGAIDFTVTKNKDTSNKVITLKYFDSGGVVYQITIISLNSDLTYQLWTNLNPDGTKINSIKYEYDGNKQVVVTTLLSAGGSLLEVKKYEYDDKGNVIKESKSLRGRPAVTYFKKYEFDPKGNWIKMEILIGDKLIETVKRMIYYRNPS